MTNAELKELDIRIYNLLREHHIYGGVYSSNTLSNGIIEVEIEISWGDWKHEHLATDWIIKENFNVKYNSTETTEEDGSDCYSAIHRYLIEQ